MLPLAAAICLDFYLIARVTLGGTAVPVLAAALFAVYATLWFGLPRIRGLRELIRGTD